MLSRRQQQKQIPTTKAFAISPDMMTGALDHVTDLLAYTDDSKATLNTQIIGVSSLAAFAGLSAVFALLTKNLKGKTFKFSLSEEEEEAVIA